MEKLVEPKLSVVNVTLDLSIQDFCTTTKEVCKYNSKQFPHCTFCFSATVFPDGVDEDTKGWLVVAVNAWNGRSHSTRSFNLNEFILKWVVSTTDIDGNSRFPQSFETADLDPEVFRDARYLERSFILNRADEFLSEGELFLRCDIYFQMTVIKHSLFIGDDQLSNSFHTFLNSTPRATGWKNGAETGNLSDYFTVFDHTSQVLTLPQFHELRKRFGVYGISPDSAPLSSESEENIRDILENVWIFETPRDKFLLSLARRPGNVGRQLINASPVFRQCINAPMKENRQKRVRFPNVSGLTFHIVLHFLKSGRVYSVFNQIVEVYTFSHLYEMENLQLKCAEEMAKSCETETQFEEREKIAALYSDENLSRLLRSHKRRNIEHLDTSVTDDRPNFDCYT